MSDEQNGAAFAAVPSPQDVLEQLTKILACEQSQFGERARRVLNYVVTETLAGRSKNIKAYTIATDVLGRRNFDAQNDPVVRIEAGRLRRELERYYLLAGPNELVKITIPKGTYVPVFEATASQLTPDGNVIDPAEQHATDFDYSHPSKRLLKWPAKRWIAGVAAAAALAGAAVFISTASSSTYNGAAERPTIAVERFDSISNDRAAMSQGITDVIIANLVKFKEIQVVDASTGGEEELSRGEARYALQGSIRHNGDRVRSTVRLVRRSDNAVIWADNLDVYGGDKNTFDIEAALADEIATAVGQPFGVMFEKDIRPDTAGGWAAYDCSLIYYSYRRTMTVEALDAAQRCLKSVSQRSPKDSTSLALLSLTYLDQVRFAYKLGILPSAAKLETASTLAEQSVDIDPNNARALQALMLTKFFRNDIPAALESGAKAYQLNPNDTEIAGEYGLRLSFSGKWETGCDLVSKAVSKNAGPSGYFEVGMALCAFMRNDLDAAELWSRMSDLEYNPMHRMILAAILGAAGKSAEAKKEVDWLNTNAPAMMAGMDREVATRLARPADRDRIFAGLRAAGVAIGQESTLHY